MYVIKVAVLAWSEYCLKERDTKVFQPWNVKSQVVEIELDSGGGCYR